MVALLKTGPWKLTDLKDVPKNGLKVFSCFHCGGGSTMGYKLAGYDVIGGVEIDPKMMEIYRRNHNPKFSYLMGVQDFNKIPDKGLPSELFELDILDGSPPCSSFSMAGSREGKWGKNTKFREGQAVQVLDDLFFHFIETARKLKPKVVVAENVKGLIAGNARFYVKQIFEAFDKAGYESQLFLLNASRMGVPQKRERTVFIARRKDLGFGEIVLGFDEAMISVSSAFDSIKSINYPGKDCSNSKNHYLWEQCKPGQQFSDYHPKGSLFNNIKIPKETPCNTIPGKYSALRHYESDRHLSKPELLILQSFPIDYQTDSDAEAGYIVGMSVPPFMIQRIADQIERQWLRPSLASDLVLGGSVNTFDS